MIVYGGPAQRLSTTLAVALIDTLIRIGKGDNDKDCVLISYYMCQSRPKFGMTY